LNETIRRGFSLRFTENEGIVDGHGPCLMSGMPIFQKHCYFKKRPQNPQILKNSKILFAFQVAFL